MSNRGFGWRSLAAGSVILLSLTGCVSKASVDGSAGSAGGDMPADFTEQEVKWEDCGEGLECATVLAPLDWNNPDINGETVELALMRKPSTNPNPKGTLFLNPGGPGASGIEYLEYSDAAETLLDEFNLASWDPRGVGDSSAIECYTDKELDDALFSVDPNDAEAGTQEWLDDVYAENQKMGAGCERHSGELYKYVGTDSTVQDLDLLRELVGDEKLNYLGFSYGTFIGAKYADRFPNKAGRLVLDGALDPTADTADVVAVQTKGFELALTNYLTACVEGDCWFDGTVDDGKKIIADMLAKVKAEPLTGSDRRQVGVDTLLTAIATPLYSENNWPLLDDLFSEVLEGGADTALYLADFYYSRDNEDGTYYDNSQQAFIAINCLDYTQSKPDLAAMRADAEQLAAAAPLFGPYQGYSDASCWGWPATAADTRTAVTGAGAPPIIVIGTTGDPATPYEWAVALSEQLESGTLLTFKGEGHTAYGGSSSCINNAVDSYFKTGAVPESGTVCD
ncbi:alpha/beta hydrolase [Canibacter zhoujuaniae]|uniref:alpha/beta hydrolase n=1 Tax=Canibacter zhoujuaniae TaxID=2708343 RepID=UPI001420768C|nr:alpha/beta fold hydrolase [Canibacter zhoujuaniae]